MFSFRVFSFCSHGRFPTMQALSLGLLVSLGACAAGWEKGAVKECLAKGLHAGDQQYDWCVGEGVARRRENMQRIAGAMGQSLQQQSMATAADTSPSRPLGHLKGEHTQGMTKLCLYDRLGSVDSVTVSAASLCPLTLP